MRRGALTTFIVALLASVAVLSQPLSAKPVVEVAFVLDTTGSMRGLNAAERHAQAAERQAQIERNLHARRRLNEKLSTLIAERDAFVAAQRSKVARHTGDSFDRAIEQTLRMQIKR